MELSSKEAVILFADIAGSTQLYRRLGDRLAYQCIRASLSRAEEHVQRFGGRVIEVIGDEIMTLFDSVAQSIECAAAIQKHFAKSPVSGSQYIKMRIGMHLGPVEFNGSHPFGDTVNIAARVVSLCDAGRIVATQSSIADTPPNTGYFFRPYQRTKVKGVEEPISLEEVIWDKDCATALLRKEQNHMATQFDRALHLHYLDKTFVITRETVTFTIGRDPTCHLPIHSQMASRRHAKLEYREGEFILTDHSTNGTFVRIGDPKAATKQHTCYLHRQNLRLTEFGHIVLGARVTESLDSHPQMTEQIRFAIVTMPTHRQAECVPECH